MDHKININDNLSLVEGGRAVLDRWFRFYS